MCVPDDYIIYQSGSLTKALNGTTLVVDYSNTDASTVFNACIGAVTYGASIAVKPGSYLIKTPIDYGLKVIDLHGMYPPRSFVDVESSSCLKLSSTLGADYMIKMGVATGDVYFPAVRNLALYGIQNTTCLGAIYGVNISNVLLENLLFDDFYGTAPTAGFGINFEQSGSHASYYGYIQNCKVRRCSVGIRLGPTCNSWTINGGHITNNRSGNPVIYGLFFDNSTTSCVMGALDIENIISTNSVGIYISTGRRLRFFGTRFEGNYANVLIDAGADTGYNQFFGCNFYDILATGPGITDNGTNKSFYYGCYNYNSIKWGSTAGTGAQQTIAHGLGKTPTQVILSDKDNGALPYQSAAADATNIYITAVNAKNYTWEAKF